ncbi:3-phosphoshikimate 1-carboxyvinyltransferase [Dethiosulfovibrio salsuginis]|uniref:3-phosphoshikimate 1-carboxyvinyltransferase n=1 Tax=Dethiosulfovibrio salsuginis TaxID=561720 RepID=A0A1X7J438_9BACT|nr:3-phosphoshikimate 1-carboxyvinyltransferase [Dethiosulfovibrio salsuginis]SMG22207.1 3-phosphoshikimate 1-carboxyvinyltransferase [Dethiosulfovibrio salsuginis]
MGAVNSVKVVPGSVRGTVEVPGDKSISHRVGMIGALSKDGIEVTNFSPGADCSSTLECVKALGCDVVRSGDSVKVSRGKGLSDPSAPLDAGNSGTTARLMCGLLAGVPGTFSVMSGDESLQGRPMSRVVDPLRILGAKIDGRDGGKRLPLAIRGTRLTGGQYVLPVASAQVKSALLLAGLSAQGSVTVVEPLPTRDHTEIMLEHLGVPVRKDGGSITVYPFDDLPGGSWRVPGDFSSAAFWAVAAAISPGSEVSLIGVGLNPTRSGLLEVLKSMGLDCSVMSPRTQGGEMVADLVVRTSVLSSVTVGESQVPSMVDELPVLAVTATQASGTTEIRGASELRVKECDRIAAVAEGLRAMGAQIVEHDDGWTIPGGQALHSAVVDSHGDHRIAMAMAVAALVADGPVEIKGSDCVAISYPDFFSHLNSLSEGR